MKTIIIYYMIVVLVLGLALASLIQTQGNSPCAQFCHATFPTSSAPITAGDCTSQAARGFGPCYICGPAQTGVPHIDVCGQGTSGATCCTQQAPMCVGGNCVSGGTCPNEQLIRFTQVPPICVDHGCANSPSECCERCKTTIFTTANGAGCQGQPCDSYFSKFEENGCGAIVHLPYSCKLYAFEGTNCPSIVTTPGGTQISHCLSSL